MFPEYRELIAKLKLDDPRFARIFEEHNRLDDKITGLTNSPVTSGVDNLDDLKREKLRLKDEIYVMLKEADKK